MIRVAFELDGPTVTILRQHTATRAAARTRGGVPGGNTRRYFFGLNEKGNCFFHFGGLTSREKCSAEAEANNFQEITAINSTRRRCFEISVIEADVVVLPHPVLFSRLMFLCPVVIL